VEAARAGGGEVASPDRKLATFAPEWDKEALEKPETLEALARSDHPTARGAAALIEAGFAPDTEVEGLTPGSVTRQLAELLARELQKVYEQLGEVYESAFVETATGASLELLVDGLRLRPDDDDDD
jgi:hypothetical protein